MQTSTEVLWLAKQADDAGMANPDVIAALRAYATVLTAVEGVEPSAEAVADWAYSKGRTIGECVAAAITAERLRLLALRPREAAQRTVMTWAARALEGGFTQSNEAWARQLASNIAEGLRTALKEATEGQPGTLAGGEAQGLTLLGISPDAPQTTVKLPCNDLSLRMAIIRLVGMERGAVEATVTMVLGAPAAGPTPAARGRDWREGWLSCRDDAAAIAERLGAISVAREIEGRDPPVPSAARGPAAEDT